jgi:hypothetical protein
MFILCGTKNNVVTPVAVFDENQQLATYVNSLVLPPSTELDPVRKAASLLADCDDQQSILLDTIWDTWPDGLTVLAALKTLPRNPVLNV